MSKSKVFVSEKRRKELTQFKEALRTFSYDCDEIHASLLNHLSALIKEKFEEDDSIRFLDYIAYAPSTNFAIQEILSMLAMSLLASFEGMKIVIVSANEEAELALKDGLYRRLDDVAEHISWEPAIDEQISLQIKRAGWESGSCIIFEDWREKTKIDKEADIYIFNDARKWSKFAIENKAQFFPKTGVIALNEW